MAPAIQSGLNGADICCHIPKALQYGPMLHQGLKLPHIYTLQGIARLADLLINHNHLQPITGFLHQANLEQMIVGMGLCTHILEYSNKRYGQLTTFSLPERTWKFLSDAHMILHHDVKHPQPQPPMQATPGDPQCGAQRECHGFPPPNP
jgi:hypothetical protein